MTKSFEKLENVLAVSVSLIAGEHLFSATLSSPWSTQKFVETPEDRAMVNELLFIASTLSLIIAGGIAWYIEDKWPVIFTLMLVLFYVVIYELALDGKL
jgi:hypothetical protein